MLNQAESSKFKIDLTLDNISDAHDVGEGVLTDREVNNVIRIKVMEALPETNEENLKSGS